MTVKVRFVEEIPAGLRPKKRGRKPGRTAGKYTKVVKSLKTNPGRWALVQKVQKRSRTLYARKTLTTFGCEVTVRKMGGSWYHIYARYNPKIDK